MSALLLLKWIIEVACGFANVKNKKSTVLVKSVNCKMCTNRLLNDKLR